MKFYKKVLLLSILILSGLLSSSSISRAETFTISATDSYLVNGSTFNTELKNAMAVIGNNGTLPSITSINLVDEPFTSDINVAQSGKPIYMKANYLGSSNPNFIASVHAPYKSDSTTQYDRTDIVKNSYKMYKYTFGEPGTYVIDIAAYGYISENLYVSYKDLEDDYFETNTSLKSADYNNKVDCSYSSKTASYKYTVTEAPKTITFIWETGNYVSTDSRYGFTATLKTDQQYSIDLYTEANNIYLNENSSYMFDNCQGLASIDETFFNKLKADHVTNLSRFFYYNSSLTYVPKSIENWNTSNVKDISNFCFTVMVDEDDRLDLSNWDVSNVKNVDSIAVMSNLIKNISGWQLNSLTKMDSMFYYFYGTDIIGLDTLDTSNITSMKELFAKSSLSDFSDVEHWNTSNVTNMNGIFCHSKLSGNLDLSNWDVSKVTTFEGAFDSNHSYNLDTLNLSGWDLSSCTTILYMFYGISGSANNNIIGLDTWDVSNIKNFDCVFQYSPGIKNLGDLSSWRLTNAESMRSTFENCTNLILTGYENWNPSKCTNFTATFKNCDKLTNVDLTSWSVSNSTTFTGMFNDCSNLTSVDLSNWNVSNSTSFERMFNSCTNLTTVSVDNWSFNTTKPVNLTQMFKYCSNLTNLDVSTWNLNNTEATCSDMFWECKKLTTLNVSNWGMSNTVKMGHMFYKCSSLETLDMSNWTISNKLQYIDYMFCDCPNLTSVGNINNWDVSGVVDASVMFKNCAKLPSVDLSNWRTSSCTNFSEMFSGCTSFTELDLSNWNMEKATNIGSMFSSCSNLTTVGHLDNWNLSNVTYMSTLFSRCNKLTDVGDLSNWNFPKATSLYNLFCDCLNLESIGDISNWNMSNITDVSYLFKGCQKLKHLGNISSWDLSKVTDAGMMFWYCYELTTDEIGDFSTWNLPKCTNIPSFANCKKLEVIDMSNWNCTQGSFTMSSEFSGCTNLKSVDMSGIKIKNATDISNWFSGCTSLQKLRLPTDIPNLTQDKLSTYPKTMYSIQDMMDNFGTDNYRIYQKDSYINPLAYSTNWLVSDYSYTLTYKDIEENELGTQTIDVANGPVTLQGVDDIPEDKRMFGWAYTKSDAENGVVNLKTGVIAPNGIFPGIQGLDTATLDDDILVLYAVVGDPLSSTLLKGDKFNETLKGLVGLDSTYDEDTRIYNIKWTTEDISSDANIIHVEQDGETTPVYARLGTETRTITTTEMVSKTRNHTKYLHSDNVNDSGTRIGNYPSSTTNSMRIITKSVTIPNVDSITVTLKYGFDEGNDSGWFSSSQSQTDYITVGPTNSTTSYTRKLSRSSNDSSTWSNNKTKTTTITVPGDTVYINLVTDKAYTYSSWGRQYTDTDGYGFYATLTAVENYEEEEEVSHDETVEVVELYTEAELVYFNEDSSEMFYDFTKLDTLDFINTKVSTIKATDMREMFYKCKSLKNIDFTKFNTSNVTNFSYIFNSVNGLNTIDISSWDMSKAENVSDMFEFSDADKIILPALSSSLDTTSLFTGTSGHTKNYITILDDNLDGISDDNIKYSKYGVSAKQDNLSHTYVFGNEIELYLDEGKFISNDTRKRYLYIDYTKNPIIDLTDIQNDIECDEYNFSHFGDYDTLVIKDSLDTSILDFGEFTSITLYGEFSEKTFKIVYHVNNPNSVTDYNMDTYEDTTEYIVSESSETLKDNMFTKPGYKFNKWKREDNTLFEENDSLEDICKWDGSVHDTINMYANWTPIKYTIYIHSNDILNANNEPIADSVVKTLEVNYDHEASTELQVLINELIFEGYTDELNEDCHIICEVDEGNNNDLGFTITNGRTNMADIRKLNGDHSYREIKMNSVSDADVSNLTKTDGAELHFYCINALNKVKTRSGTVSDIYNLNENSNGYYNAIYYGDVRVYYKPNNLSTVFRNIGSN